jgi:putative DNA primase/helicase
MGIRFRHLNLDEIASALGGKVHRGTYVVAPGPGHSGKDGSLKVWLDRDGRLACHSFAGDDWAECMDHVRARLGMSKLGLGGHEERAADRRSPEERLAAALQAWEKDVADCRQDAVFANKLWSCAVDPGSTMVVNYLKRRGLELHQGIAGPLVRFLGDCPRGRERAPAMLVRFAPIVHLAAEVLWRNDPPVSCIQRIFLNPGRPKGHDGKWLLGHPFSLPKPRLREGQVVVRPAVLLQAMKLSPDEDVSMGLHLSEGFETGLAAMMAGFRPLWVTYSAGAMARFPVLPGIEAITLMADNDDSRTGELAARTCCEQWQQAGRECRIIIGNNIGDDWADVWEMRK